MLSLKSKHDLRIIFMGTPDFAVASLQMLVEAGCNIVGVITAPDKPAGRGMQMHSSAVKKYALEKDLHILQPEKLKDTSFIQQLKTLNADLQVIVAFRMLPEVVWNMPSMGTINVHASLLPNYRGAAPINRAIINGEKETGITTFKLQQEIDTGNILMQEKIIIGDDETAGELYEHLKMLGADLLLKTINGLANGTLKEMPQSNIYQQTSAIKHAPKITTETCKIDWNNTSADIFNLIRGLSPYPCAFTYLNNKTLKIYVGLKEVSMHQFSNGTVHTDNKTYLKFACSDGFISCVDIQLEGKKRMKVEDFLRGYKVNTE